VIGEALRAAAEATTDPDSPLDLLALFIVGMPASLPAIAALWVTIRGQKRGRERWDHDTEKLTEIHEETVNSHKGKGNLRDQIDALETKVDEVETKVDEVVGGIAKLEQGHRELRRDLNGIREDLRQERADRIEGDRR